MKNDILRKQKRKHILEKRRLKNELEDLLERIRMQKRKKEKEREELLKLGDVRKGLRITIVSINNIKTYDASN